ncbi:hypothetical protein GIB67_042171 [Kingdonia uniflora]|uniref:Uncharacterized protein n=1 Tax=Kingdonia uniflora TaxID=39325 RepID=A0A7J7NWT0_9MAGN|nr:hypothetical protein GIB67_042171 [Kingdonia uniflora]
MKEIGRITVKREPATCAFSEDSGDEESNYNWDNLSFNTMTLKELKERYKVKKRKVPLFEDSIKEDAEICRKSDYSTVESKENESDIEELLSSFKLRVSKKPKAKRKCLSVKTPTEQVPSSSTYSLQTVRDKHVTYIKSEIVEPDFSDRQNMVCAVDVSITDSNDECSDDMPDSVNNCVMKMETWETTSITEDNSRYDVSRVLLKILEQVHPSLSASTVVIADIRERSIINHQLPCISFTEATPVTNDQSFEICVSHESNLNYCVNFCYKNSLSN